MPPLREDPASVPLFELRVAQRPTVVRNSCKQHRLRRLQAAIEPPAECFQSQRLEGYVPEPKQTRALRYMPDLRRTSPQLPLKTPVELAQVVQQHEDGEAIDLRAGKLRICCGFKRTSNPRNAAECPEGGGDIEAVVGQRVPASHLLCNGIKTGFAPKSCNRWKHSQGLRQAMNSALYRARSSPDEPVMLCDDGRYENGRPRRSEAFFRQADRKSASLYVTRKFLNCHGSEASTSSRNNTPRSASGVQSL